MQCLKSLLVAFGCLAVGVFFWSLGVATAQQAPQYPLDDKLANEPAPWAVPASGASAVTGVVGGRTTSAACSTSLPPT